MDPVVRRRRLQTAKRFREQIISKYNFRIKEVARNGPRFYVATGHMGHHPAVFKSCLYTNQVDPRTSNGIKREAITLKYFHAAKLKPLNQVTPNIYHCNFTQRTWYIREYLDGQSQNMKESNFVFQPSFFNQATADWVIDFFIKLHRASRRFPDSLKKVYAKHTMKNNMGLIGWHKLPNLVNLPQIVSRSQSFLYNKARLFDTHQNVLTHYEPYASHFFRYNKNSYYLIDWENVDWGNPAHDISIIWNRAFKHPAWQKYLLKKFHRQVINRNIFKDLFVVEILLQGISNIDYFKRTNKPAEKPIRKSALIFLTNNINKILTNKFKLY